MRIQSRLKGAAAPLAISIAFLAQPALAQDDSSSKDNVIVVTGSIVRNPAAATASPVVSVSSEDLETRGISTVAEALQTLTANNAGTAQPSWSSFGFATGASAPSLRGLNDAYTLTLFNGMRSALYPLADDGYRNFVDINSIPASIVDHVDVLLDGASATYGSDAIAGVVNVVVKREIQGLHMNASYGQSTEHNDSKEYRISGTYGYGDLDEQGFNIFVNGEYQKNDKLMLNQRPDYNKSSLTDLSSICGTADQGCLFNTVQNGIQYDGSYLGLGSTLAPLFRPYDPNTLAPQGHYQYGAAGCNGLPSHTLTADEIAGSGQAAILPVDNVVCQQDLSDGIVYNSAVQRIGGNLKATFNIGSNAQAYFMFNYANVTTDGAGTPQGYASTTAAGGATKSVGAIFLPVYVCPQGESIFVGTSLIGTGCDAGNGTLNPNNPFAANGQLARVLARPIHPRETLTDATTTRFSAGIDGTFGSWHYSLNAVTSQVRLKTTNKGYIYLPGLMDAVAQGTYDFVDPYSNSDAADQILFPDNHNLARSETTQISLSVDRDFFDLPGGALNIAVAGQYRYEAIHDPSANPPDNVHPERRYYGVNAVGVDGSRRVWSGSYEISAPITDSLTVKADGSYDHYSTGQGQFSPKFEVQFKPIEQLKFRGTYSKGFRIPSFSEAFALPTTGYVSGSIVCGQPQFAAFCAAHASNPSYYSGTYNYGLTSAGNPGLSPEKTESFTGGVVFEPIHHTFITVDFWQTRINNVIVPVSSSSDIISQYYSNNGVVNVPGITVVQGTPDPQNLNALPLLGFIVGSYKNADSFLANGIDFSGSTKVPLNSMLTWNSLLNASLLLKLTQTNEDGTVNRYDGTLGACNITSCSGAPRWRVVWQNTLNFNDKAKISLTAYYTSGYSEVATDSGGVYGDCQASADNGQVLAWDNGDPVQCFAKSSFDLDGHIEYKFGGKFTVYADIQNILNTAPDFEPNAAYGLYGFNPSWQDRMFIGRWFRIGAKVDW